MTRRTSRMPSSASATCTSAPGRAANKLLTIDEVANIFNVSPRTVRRFIEVGALPVHRLGRLVRISNADIAVFLASNRAG